jgi:hypothetical protein
LASTYNNLPIYIGIKCNSIDQFGFAVDDFLVTGTLLTTENFFASNFSMYPNPATNVVNIKPKNDIAINSIQVTDINGRIVKEINGSVSDNAQVNVSDLNSGVYFIKVQTDAGVGTSKIIKK